MSEQTTLFDQYLNLDGCEIKIPHITLKENDNHYPERYLALHRDEPFLHLNIFKSDKADELVLSWTSLDKKSRFYGRTTKENVIWTLKKWIKEVGRDELHRTVRSTSRWRR